MPVRTMLPLGVLLTLILLLVARASELSAQNQALEDALEAQDQRIAAQKALLQQSLTALDPVAPKEAARIRKAEQVIEHGDLRLLSPGAHPELDALFIDLL